jgi:glycerophosphoryl diester phosphodiesterase
VLRAARAADESVPRVALVEPATWAQGSPWDPMTSAGLVAEAHREGLRIVPWTVNEPDRMGALIEFGVDAIVTDRPDVLRGVFAERGLTLPQRYDVPWAGKDLGPVAT